MSSHKSQWEGNAVSTITKNTPFLKVFLNLSPLRPSENREKTAKQSQELTSKIGRRYSFDDNGGGYQGL